MGRIIVALKRHCDVDLERETGRRGVDPSSYATHDPGLLQPPHTVKRGRRRKPDDASELDVRTVRVGLQLLEQPYVN
jgi:hypothetical protein